MTTPDLNKQNHLILVVDDEKSICGLVSQYLQKIGYHVLQAYNGLEAIDIIKSNDVHLVLSDIKMPEMDGVELLKWIREYNLFLPVIISTGFPTLDTAIEALKLGAHDYLTKPFHLEEIGEKVKRALLNRQLEEENLLFSKLVSLHEVTRVLSSTHSISELYSKFLDFSVKISHADAGSLMFFDDKSNLYTHSFMPNNFNTDFWNNEIFISGAKWSAKNREALVVDDSTNNQIPSDFPNLPSSIKSLIVFPLKTPSRTLGVLNLIRVNGNTSFSSIDLEIINVLSSQASISIDNARLYTAIKDNYLKTVRGFALAVEAKDQYTHGHSENVMMYTVLLAKKLGLKSNEVDQFKYAGLLHDVGKIGISEAILNKPGQLTPEEFDEIKKHPDLGARIISDVPFLKSLVPLIRHHHEYYNGTGYPDGLAGENIPFGARVLTVADSFEAMTSDRPYRKSLPIEKALDILEKGKGIQFDPQIADLFIEIIRSNPENKL